MQEKRKLHEKPTKTNKTTNEKTLARKGRKNNINPRIASTQRHRNSTSGAIHAQIRKGGN